ncbi:LysR family transcriptional regulator [Microbacteriaceae bacterium K1510]|nr:LysR family transcriptional regulator [Microbacteriaceae bacterium K1510]
MPSMVSSFSSAFSGLLDKDAKSTLSIPHLTLRQLVYFSAAAEHESAVRAAEALNVSPPAISGAIACLEKIVGQPLFIRRHARGLVLTRAGHHLLMDSRDIISRVQEIEALCHRKPVRNRITVGCLGDISPLVIPPLVRGFETMFPEADVRWTTGEHEQLMLRLEESNVDVAIVLDFEIAPTLHTTVLRPTPVQCVLPPEHPLAHDVVSLSDLADEPFILLDMPRTRDYILSIFGDMGLQPRIAHRAPTAEMARSLVANGFGYSLLNFISASGGKMQNGCVYRPLKGSIRPTNLVAVRQYRRRPSQALERFVQYAKEMASANLVV